MVKRTTTGQDATALVCTKTSEKKSCCNASELVLLYPCSIALYITVARHFIFPVCGSPHCQPALVSSLVNLSFHEMNACADCPGASRDYGPACGLLTSPWNGGVMRSPVIQSDFGDAAHVTAICAAQHAPRHYDVQRDSGYGSDCLAHFATGPLPLGRQTARPAVRYVPSRACR